MTAPLHAIPMRATWLSLERYRKIVAESVAPPHFFGSIDDTFWPERGSCSVVVPRHGWQYHNVASRYDISMAIKESEEEISEYLGLSLAPTHIEDEMHRYAKPYDPTTISSGRLNASRVMEKSIHVRNRHVIQTGIRAVEAIGTATVAGGDLEYLDLDGDGFTETARVTLATSYTSQADLCKIRAFVPDTDGVDEWEIRPARKKTFSGGNVILEFDIWLFIDPDTDARYPGADDFRALDIGDSDNLITSVDIYRVYTDNTQASVRFYWESDADCLSTEESGVGSQIYQDGVAIVRDTELGLLVPRAATYNETTGLWDAAIWSVGRDPDQLRVSYFAGDVSQAFLNGRSCDPLKETYARAIAYMATARLHKSICACEGTVAFFEGLQVDMAQRIDRLSYGISLRDLENPFGTRKGEVMAWNIIGKVNRDMAVEGGAI